MDDGMLWFDNDPQTDLTSKIGRAADYYRKKYGIIPDLCMVHPSMLKECSDLVDGCAGKIAVKANRLILPDHLWIGSEDKK